MANAIKASRASHFSPVILGGFVTVVPELFKPNLAALASSCDEVGFVMGAELLLNSNLAALASTCAVVGLSDIVVVDEELLFNPNLAALASSCAEVAGVAVVVVVVVEGELEVCKLNLAARASRTAFAVGEAVVVVAFELLLIPNLAALASRILPPANFLSPLLITKCVGFFVAILVHVPGNADD